MRSDIVPGGAFPDYQLPDHTGNLRKLSELQGDDPLILTLARGHYCPTELKAAPLKDLCHLGGWKSPTTVITVYQQPDTETQLEALRNRRRVASNG